MEESANKTRNEADIFRVGDRVWLNLKNIQTPQLSKKLSWINAKYMVTKVIDSHSVELDTPSGIWPRFHVDLLKRAAIDPLPSQVVDDAQPPPVNPQNKEDTIFIDSEHQEQYVDRILRAENRKIGNGNKRSVLVKWKGFAEPTWEYRENLNDTEALDIFESQYGIGYDVGEDAGAMTGRRKITKRSFHQQKKNIKKKEKNRGYLCKKRKDK